MQQAAGYQPPGWPGTSIVHLDLTAGDQPEEPADESDGGSSGRAELSTVDIPTVTVDQVDPDGTDLILDVREPQEWAAGRIETAVHIPMYDVPPQSSALPTDRKIIVVCKMGGRSAQVTSWLRGRGFDAHNLDGGMIAWAHAHRPMVTDLDVQPFIA